MYFSFYRVSPILILYIYIYIYIRLTDLVGGFSTYTTTQKNINQSSAGVSKRNGETINPSATQALKARKSRLADTEAAITLAKDGAEILLNPDGNFVQNLFVDESAAALSAQIKDTLRDALIETPNRIREGLPFNVGALLPPPLKEIEPFFQKTREEKNAQTLLSKITLVTQSTGSKEEQGSTTRTGEDQLQTAFNNIDVEQLAVISREVRENLPKYGPLLSQLGGKFVVSVLERTSVDIDRNLDHFDNEGTGDRNSPVQTIVKSAAKSVSDTANRGAQAIKSS